ncbi:MAG: protein kinase [Deltaproteobacteria bacterium]|nr:protein kinase [Deltaproteobacteria bacterium]
MFVSPGAVIAGKYRVEAMLGAGGMGVVVAATHLHLGTRVALKFLNAEMAQHPAIVERFLREAQAAATLRSEHVCRVTDVAMEGQVPYIVMELLQGHDLAATLRHGGVLSVATVADYMLQACHAIGEAHALGIVHRDLKPGNLFVAQRPDGRPLVKVLDFGIAKAPSQGRDFSLTQTSNVIGSPGYMSPEQLKSSKIVDARADIWSLGVVMYELLVGRPPFSGESVTELALRVAMDPLPPLPALLPPAAVAVVQRCLEKDPAARFQDVAQLAAALAPFTPGGREAAAGIAYVLRGQVPPPTIRLDPADPPAVSTPTTLRAASGAVEGASTPAPRRRGGLIAGVAVGVAALGIAAVVILTRPGATQPSPTTEKGKEEVRSAASPKTEDAKSEPPKTEAVKTEPGKPSASTEQAPKAANTEPAKTDPAAEPATTEPPKAESTKAGATTEPAKASAKTEPAHAASAKPESTKAAAPAHAASTKAEPARAVAPAHVASPKAEPVKVPPAKKEPKKPSVEDIGESRM